MSTDFVGAAENKCRCSISPKTPTPLMMNTVKEFKSNNLIRSHKYDAGCDIKSAEEKIILPLTSEIFDTGLHTAIPSGYVGMVRGRSGLAFKHKITTFHGTIDSKFRGNIKCILFNMSNEPYKVKVGDKIAQLITTSVMLENYQEIDELPESEDGRDENGFGSTGK